MTVLMYPIATEKSVGMIERQNTIAYVVAMTATKPEIKKEFEALFEAKVEGIRTVNTADNHKKAFIKLKKGFKASDIAVKLKLV
ncbi:MAG: 50S ribosomal protein L23 [Candidatus Marsarchaeota archaeon]|jgi:ribosomal protein L23|nr:50S ribosomal protein L23 [Candidatus Marsarchaeota archaeon]MCL5431187.1 50S ribosomal protein L23 [Candidatus Marsarchaeota archaeon]